MKIWETKIFLFPMLVQRVILWILKSDKIEFVQELFNYKYQFHLIGILSIKI